MADPGNDPARGDDSTSDATPPAQHLHRNGGVIGRPARLDSGRWVRGEASIARDAEALRLRSKGWTYRRISEHLGYGGEGNVHRAIKVRTHEMMAPALDEYRQVMDSQLDELHAAALEVLEATHLKVNNGEVVYANGEPIKDDSPVLAAVTTILKVLDRRAKLWGLDAPVKSEVGLHGVHYTVDGVDMDQV